MSETEPQGQIGGQVFRALQGHKIVAGGDAPGTREVRSPTLKGSHYPQPQGAAPVGRRPGSTLSGSHLVGARIPGAMPPAIVLIPSGDQGWTLPKMFWG